MLSVMGIRESAFHLDGSTCISIDFCADVYPRHMDASARRYLSYAVAVLHVYVAAMTYYIHIRTINKLGKSMT